MIEQVWYCICMNVVESTDEEKKAVAEVMKMLYKESAIRKELLGALVLFSEQERKKYPDWRKGQALCSCASIAFPHVVNSKILKSDADCYYDDSKIQEFLFAVDDYLTEEKPLVGIFWFYYGLPFLFTRFLLSKACATTRPLQASKITRNIGKSLAKILAS